MSTETSGYEPDKSIKFNFKRHVTNFIDAIGNVKTQIDRCNHLQHLPFKFSNK